MPSIPSVAFLSIMNNIQRSFRFSLRSYLLACFGLALLFGVVIDITKHVAEKKAAKAASVDAILAEKDGIVFLFSSKGCEIQFSPESDPHRLIAWDLGPDGVARILGHAANLTSIISLSLSGSRLTPAALMHVQVNPGVRELDLYSCEGLSVDTCRILTRLYPNVSAIDVSDSDVGKDGLAALGRLQSLSKINVSYLSLTVTDLVRACNSISTLKYLAIQQADLSGQLAHFCRLSGLETLDISLGCFSEADLASFLDCTHCTKVIAVATEMTDCRANSFDHPKSVIVDWGLKPVE